MFEHPEKKSTAFITIGRTPSELYECWQDSSVRARIADHYMDRIVPVATVPGESMTWLAPDSDAPHYRGRIHFHPAPADYGTEVSLTLEPADDPGLLDQVKLESASVVTKALAAKTLRHFKSLMETGEIPSLKANPSTRHNQDEK